MASAFDEAEDLTSCSVCFFPFDESVHKPKFLSCHHTFCQDCIKSIARCKESSLACPKCRKKTTCPAGQESELTNNPYALHMISNSIKKNSPPQPRWCLICKKEAAHSCSKDHHPTFSMDSKSPEFCQKLERTYSFNEKRLASIINRRRDIKTYLEEVSHAHKIVGDRIRALEEENDLHFAQMVSLFEQSPAEEETAASLFNKVIDTQSLLQRELNRVFRFEKTYLPHLNGIETTISIICQQRGRLLESKMPFFEPGFIPINKYQEDQIKTLKAASHILLSLLKIDSGGPSLKTTIPRVHFSNPDSSALAFTFSKMNSESSIGTVLIKPSPAFYGPNARFFGQLSPSSPTIFVNGFYFESAYPLSYVIIGQIGPLLNALFPDPATFLSLASPIESRDVMNVKLVMDRINVGGVETDVQQLVFVLGATRFWEKSYSPRKRLVGLGTIIGGREVIGILSQMKLTERSGISITIDYRQLL